MTAVLYPAHNTFALFTWTFTFPLGSVAMGRGQSQEGFGMSTPCLVAMTSAMGSWGMGG